MWGKTLLLVARKRRAPPSLLVASRHLTSSSSSANNDRLGRTLYRQLIRWCRNTDNAIPLSSFVPPVTLKPPHVDGDSLAKLASMQDDSLPGISSLLPPNSKVEAHQMTIPISNANDAANLFRVVFRMNNRETDPTVFKQRISTAFEALKSLNQLTGGLTSLTEQREKHLDRTGVHFRVGQVVQHKKERWRGVITGWQRTQTTFTEPKFSSLTKKSYGESQSNLLDDVPSSSEEQADANDIQYTLILDSGDAHLLGGRRNVHDVSGEPVAMQADLELLEDDSLVRIRSNWIPQYFDRFDSARHGFVPTAIKDFEYPVDDEAGVSQRESSVASNTEQRNELGAQVVAGVQEFASKLERHILDVTSCSESRGLDILASVQQRLSALAHGDVVPDSAFLSPTDVSQANLATFHLRQLLNLTLEISELLWIRELSKENKDRVRFSVGEIVQHKKYGFRGVIVAWDPKAAVDVSHWDGLTDIEDPGELPFYHIVPDQQDCVEAFGGERPFRYVCEENLEACPRQRSFINVDLDPEWERSSDEPKYHVPSDVRFKYALDSEEDEITAECLAAIRDDISRLQVLSRDASDNTDSDFADVARNVSLENLFGLLGLADTMDDAIVLEETIKEIWKSHDDHGLRSKLDKGIADLVRGNKERALTVFLEIVEEDADYAEAWNKAATCYYMLGNMQSSLESAERTLELIPKHFQAMNGLGLVHYETRRYKLAAQTFRQSLTLDPWSPVSSRLSACLDMLHGRDLEEERASPLET